MTDDGIEKAIQQKHVRLMIMLPSRCIWEPMLKWAGIDEDK